MNAQELKVTLNPNVTVHVTVDADEEHALGLERFKALLAVTDDDLAVLERLRGCRKGNPHGDAGSVFTADDELVTDRTGWPAWDLLDYLLGGES